MTTKTAAFRDTRQLSGGAACRPASFAQFDAGPPQLIEPDGTPTWIARGANFVVAASRVAAGAKISHHAIPDESMLLVSPSTSVTVAARGASEAIRDEALAILPPGSVDISANEDGLLIRIFSTRAADMANLAVNARDYANVHDVAPLEYWPDPTGGYRLRVYALRDYEEDVGFGRLFRSTNLMVNIFEPAAAPRSPSRLSPHDHADFEQGSLTLGGDFTHYLRTPWGPDSTAWRPDRVIECSGATLLVIPPRMIHTTSWSTRNARLVDIFAPPRDDFSIRPRWVRNGADYPLPGRLHDESRSDDG